MSVGDALNRAVQRRQWALFATLAGVVLALFALWMGRGGAGAPAPLGGIEAHLSAPGEAEAGWVRQSENRLGIIEAQIRDLETNNNRLRDDNERLQLRLRQESEDALAVIDRQAALIDELAAGAGPRTSADAANPFAQAAAIPVVAPPAAAGAGPANPPIGPRRLEFSLQDRAPASGGPQPIPLPRPTAAYVPAGSYAEAVMIAGADASASVQSQGDPRPVLMRLTSPAYGAAVDGVAEETDIEGCSLTGAAYGDLSSEKVYVRLQTLACAGASPGTVIETDVSGFVAGGGSAGVRGPVVSREGSLVQRAFLAGVFSGVGQGANRAFGPQAVLSGGGAAAIANTDIESIGRAGVGAGAGSAGQRVSDYLIDRAEQYQPVIQLAAGTPVTVVFLEGAWLDGRGYASAAEGGS